ncbi:MAG TPA: DUF3090 family protein [Candidatus Caenarcaniphilales bacterium]|nr:DUF3090 family protein [Candidatus Caenarcaniphilales bacterium]
MTRRIFTFDPPDRFVCGTVGQPGQRTFYLQASKGSQVVSVALEKAQVAVLAERLAVLLLSLKEGDVPLVPVTGPSGEADAAPLAEPVIEAFRVGTLTLGWDGEQERVVIEAREMRSAFDEESEEDELAEAVPDDAVDGPDLVRVHLTPDEAHAFVTRAVAVVQAGRPPCPMCGEPLEPTGHFCPRRNGYTH